MANSYFCFKYFRVEQSNCAMKVGTDGVLLGAWATVKSAKSCLDIGTGTGLLALMVAQRNRDVAVVAIELDDEAVIQAKENVEASPWPNRIQVVHSDVRSYCAVKTFDHIISNPPYFNDSLKSSDTHRSLARHTSTLSYMELLACVKNLLAPQGIFSLILPYDVCTEFIDLAKSHNLYCSRFCKVMPLPNANPKRALMEFSFSNSDTVLEELEIESGGRHCYSAEYKELTKEFYLDKL
ncbi:MAG: methyltransferase [Paludibacteraceae bacterium]|nr:methyltransferase [Paludibacteraceae bacterium]